MGVCGGLVNGVYRILSILWYAFQIEVQKPCVRTLILLGERHKTLLVVEVQCLCVCIHSDEPTSRLAVIPI